ncbi:P-loop containing nucleoside triphosphate hydrolase protein [Mycena olivaceomarginata]|nr:P-loop containing nucleoside triphosphate hydrolase protein [Mycena olivaceomarginata]
MPPSTIAKNRLENKISSKHKDDCVQLLEQIHKLLNVIVILHIKSDAAGEMSPEVLHHLGKFTGILHKIHTFVEAQQKGNKVKSFFHQEMQKDAQRRHQEVLDVIEKLSEATASGVSTGSRHYSWSSNSSTSISMLPSEPKIFHGREPELSDILHLFNTRVPRIAILGAGGIGKTSLASALLHHPDIVARYAQNRFVVACNPANTKLELVNLIGAHLGLKPGKDLVQSVLQHFSNNPPSLLILDELETLWEPITMQGAECPAKVHWTRRFLKPLQPLDQEAARLTFTDIADSGHSLEEVDQILSLTDNMPLAISLLAHLVNTEGCTNVLSHWDKEKTSLISEGFDKRSNLDLSISLSLSSPQIQLLPHGHGESAANTAAVPPAPPPCRPRVPPPRVQSAAPVPPSGAALLSGCRCKHLKYRYML